MLKKLIGGLFIVSISFGQTTANPQFSVVGDLIMDDLQKNPNLYSSGIEIAVQGYVNPFARADVYLHKHNDESAMELEEAVMTIERGLPFGLGLRVGKFRPDLGKINKDHAHLFPFIEAPSGMANILGEEFWAGTGLEASIFLPLPWYSNFSIGSFDSGLGGHNHGSEKEDVHYEDKDEYKEKDEHDHGKNEKQEQVFSARWGNFFELNNINHIEIGTSYYRDPENNLMGADFKYKWRPNKYRSITIQGEIVQLNIKEEHHDEEHHDEVHKGEYNIKSDAGYLMINYQFNKSFNFGIIGDYYKETYKETEINPSIFFGFSPAEESTVFRLKVGQVEDHESHKKHLKTTAQIIWSLGPHKPHRY
tara:strand:+ start:3634 stop:4722 length:1089 start_codon:yes stop_codon:yes gene_type:complete